MDAIDQPAECTPIAAILYDAGAVPSLVEITEAANNTGEFTVSHAPPENEGWAEVLRDGLTFDLRGLAGGKAALAPDFAHFVGLGSGMEEGGAKAFSALQIFPGPHIAGAQRLLPVVRVAAALADSLAKIGSPYAVCWIPARNAVDPLLFRKALMPWLGGGPFPAMTLVSLSRPADGQIATTGLKFLIGQEFSLSDGGEGGPDYLARVAVRLVDWLVAHGPVTAATQATLAGTGAVFLEAKDATSIIARCC